MSDATKEVLWMTGCTTIMVAVGLIALIGYARLKSESKQRGEAPK